MSHSNDQKNLSYKHSQSKTINQSGSAFANKDKSTECPTQHDPPRHASFDNNQTMATSTISEQCSNQSGSYDQSSDRHGSDTSSYRGWIWRLFQGLCYILIAVANQLFMLVADFQPQHLPIGFVRKVAESYAHIAKLTDKVIDNVPVTRKCEAAVGENNSITAADQVTIIRLVIEHAYNYRHHEIVRNVVNALPGALAVDVVQYFPVSDVSRLLTWALDKSDISFILTLLLKAYDNKMQNVQPVELTEIMSNVDISGINRLLSSGCDVNTVNVHGRSLLWYLSYIGLLDAVSALIQAPADVNAKDFTSATVLYVASQNGHRDVVQLLLDHHAAVNQACSDTGQTPLFIASMNGHSKVVQLLLIHRAAVNQADSDGVTPIFMASCNGHSQVVQLLLGHQAAVNKACSEYGHTPLFMASMKGYSKVVQLLLDHRAAVNQACSDTGYTPLFIASCYGHKEVVQLLLNHRAAVNQACCDTGHTSLFISSSNGHKEVVQLLLDHGATVNQACSNYGHTPLFISSCNGHKDVVQLLLDHNAAVNQTAFNGDFPLFIASQMGHGQVVERLLVHQAAVNQAWPDGVTALYIASRKGYRFVVELLLAHQAAVNQANSRGSTPLYAASMKGHSSVVRLLLDHHAAVNRAHSNGETALCAACKYGHTQVVQLLLGQQAAVNRTTIDGRIPLYSACAEGHEHIVKTLLKCGADVNSSTASGHLPLSTACAYGHLNIVKILIEHGAKVYHKSKYSVTPFFAACAACQYDVVDYLLRKYKDIVQNADLGHSPLHACIFLTEVEVNLYLDLFCIPLESNSYSELKVIKPKIISQDPKIANIPIANRCRVVKLLLESGSIKNINDLTDVGETALFLACTQGFTEIVEMLYSAGGDITLGNYVGCSPLSTAVIHGHLDTTKWLLTCPEIDINVTDNAGCTPLFRASEYSRLKFVNELLDKGCDVNITDNELISPLAIACKSGHTDIVVAIFEHFKTTSSNAYKKLMVKKPLCLYNKKGVSVLDFACEGGDHKIVKLLLDQGIDPTKSDVNGNTALHRACEHLRLESIDELLKRIRDLNVENRMGESPLMMIPYSLSKVASHEDRILILIKHLLMGGANVNLEDYKGYNPLFRACEVNSISVASVLLDNGACIDATDKIGRSILHAAVTSTNKHLPFQPMMDWIISHGVNVNQQDSNGMTALHLAVMLDKMEMSSYLVSRNSDLLLLDKFGISPVCHMTKFPNTLRLFMPQLKGICSREIAMMCCRFSYWWQTFSDKGIKKELEELSGCSLDMPAGPHAPPEQMSTTESELGFWKEMHFQNDARSLLRILEKYGRVTETDMAKTVIDSLDVFISAVAEQISPNADFTPVKAGSLAEGTKAMQPDEGDYILQQRVLSIQHFDLPENYTNADDFGRLRVRTAHVAQIQEQHPHLITELDGLGEFYLDRNGLFQNSHRYVGKVLNDPEFWKQFPMFCRLSCKDVCPDDVTIRHLDLIYSDNNYAWMPLNVDLVPAIDSPHWHPPWCRQDEFCQKYLRKNGCRFIAKWAIGAHEDPTLFRISFEKCEKELFHTMPLYFKKAYQLGKILKSISPKVLNSTIEIDREKIDDFRWLEDVSSFITSYHMKTTIFGMYEEYCHEVPGHRTQSREFDIDQVVHCTHQMFTRLTKSYKRQNLRNFWLPGENLLIDAKYGKYGWCAYNYARLLQWLLEPGTEVPQFLTSEKDTQPPKRA